MDANTLYCEPMVTAFLSADPKVFVSPQYKLVLEPAGTDTDGRRKEEKLQWPDVVAVVPCQDLAYLVEITIRATGYKPVAEKVAGYVRNKEMYLDLLNTECGYKFRNLEPWVFLPKKFNETFQAHYAKVMDGKGLKRVTALEIVAQPWKYLVKDRRIKDCLIDECCLGDCSTVTKPA